MKFLTFKNALINEFYITDNNHIERFAIGYSIDKNSIEIGFNLSFSTHLWIGISLFFITIFIHINSKEERNATK